MRSLLHVTLLLVLAALPVCAGEGTATATLSESRLTKRLSVAMTQSTNAWASYATNISGRILRAAVVADTGATGPTNGYNVRVEDDAGINIFGGFGAALNSNVTSYVTENTAASNNLPIAVDGVLTIILTNAGPQNAATTHLWWQ